MRNDTPLSEFSLIDHYFTQQRISRGEVVEGIGDDAALLNLPPGLQLAVAIDTLIAGRHFPEGTAPEDIAYKALAVNLSDLAAMGAEPAWFTLSLSLPEAGPAFLDAFSRGLFALAEQHRMQLVGGDTVRGPLVVTVQVAGQLPAGQGLLRSGASVGDLIYVSGTPGDAGAGLAIAQRQLACDEPTCADYLLARLHRPTPRCDVGVALRGVASAAIDISDGLVADLGHLLARSGVAARVDLARLPLSPALLLATGSRQAAYAYALSAGDDYELCFTIAPEAAPAVAAIAAASGCPLTPIGECLVGDGVDLVEGDRPYREMLRAGFDHFGASAAEG